MTLKVKTKKGLHDSCFSFRNKLIRVIWYFTYFLLFRFSPTPMFKYRCILLKIFGANIAMTSRIYPSASIWLPSNLAISDNSTIGPYVKVYNQGRINIGCKTIISQGVHLCASTHDYDLPTHPIVLSNIIISDNVWICAEAFIGPNSNIADGTVIGARAVISKVTEPWTVYAGNPAKKLKNRNRF